VNTSAPPADSAVDSLHPTEHSVGQGGDQRPSRRFGSPGGRNRPGDGL